MWLIHWMSQCVAAFRGPRAEQSEVAWNLRHLKEEGMKVSTIPHQLTGCTNINYLKFFTLFSDSKHDRNKIINYNLIKIMPGPLFFWIGPTKKHPNRIWQNPGRKWYLLIVKVKIWSKQTSLFSVLSDHIWRQKAFLSVPHGHNLSQNEEPFCRGVYSAALSCSRLVMEVIVWNKKFELGNEV